MGYSKSGKHNPVKLSNSEKNSFFISKLSEAADRADKILSGMQISLGFIMAMTTALLTVLVSVVQIISGNVSEYADTVINSCNIILVYLCPPNVLLWAACVMFSFVGTISNLIALEIHIHAANSYKALVLKYNNTVSELLSKCSISADMEYIILLPHMSDRIKRGSVRNIYVLTAVSFHFLCTSFLTCLVASIIFPLFNINDSTQAFRCLLASFTFLFVICTIWFLSRLGRTGYTTEWHGFLSIISSNRKHKKQSTPDAQESSQHH